MNLELIRKQYKQNNSINPIENKMVKLLKSFKPMEKWNCDIDSIFNKYIKDNVKYLTLINDIATDIDVLFSLKRFGIIQNIELIVDSHLKEYGDFKKELYQLSQYHLSNVFANFRALIDILECKHDAIYPFNELFRIIQRDLIIYKIGLPLKQLFDKEIKSNKEQDTCSFFNLFEKIKNINLKPYFKYQINSNISIDDKNQIDALINDIDKKKANLYKLEYKKSKSIYNLVEEKLKLFINKWVKHSTTITYEKTELTMKINDLIFIFNEITIFAFAMFILYFAGARLLVSDDRLSKKLIYISKNNNKNIWLSFWDVFINEWSEIMSVNKFSEMVKKYKR